MPRNVHINPWNKVTKPLILKGLTDIISLQQLSKWFKFLEVVRDNTLDLPFTSISSCFHAYPCFEYIHAPGVTARMVVSFRFRGGAWERWPKRPKKRCQRHQKQLVDSLGYTEGKQTTQGIWGFERAIIRVPIKQAGSNSGWKIWLEIDQHIWCFFRADHLSTRGVNSFLVLAPGLSWGWITRFPFWRK